MNPDEMQAWLDKAVRLAKKGHAPEKISAWLQSRTNGQFSSGQELSQAIIAARKETGTPRFEAFQREGRAKDAAFLQGLTSKFSDEALGVWAGARGGMPAYRAARDYEREAAKEGGAGAELAGAVTQGILTLPAFGVGAAGGYLANIWKAAAAGGLFGAVTEAGAAPEMRDVPGALVRGGGVGAGVGATAGALLPPIATIMRTGRGWLNTLRGDPKTLSQVADLQLGNAMLGTAPDAATAMQPLDRAVELNLPIPVPADMNSMTTRLARRSINASPSLTDMAHELSAARVGQRPARLAEGLARETGVPEDVAREMVRGSKAATQRAGKMLYGPLNKEVLSVDTGIPQLLDELAAAHPEVATQITRIAKRNIDDPLTFEVANSIRQHLEEVGWNAMRRGKEYQVGRALVDAAGEIEGALVKNVPAYAGVRDKYKALMDVQRAYAQGAKSATTALSDTEMEAFNAMSDEAKAAWRAGKQYATTSRLRSADPLKSSDAFKPITQATPLGETAGVGGPAREGWKQMFPTEGAVANFDDMGRLARRQAGTEQRLTGGSLTDQGLSDIGTDFAQQVAKTSASGPQSFVAGLARQGLDAVLMPQNQRIGSMVGSELMAPYTKAARDELIRKMELAAVQRARRGLLDSVTLGALLSGSANTTAGGR